ncbi:hypothetical protein CYMTET_29484, partial [Cymbomonas tetramitiformis]
CLKELVERWDARVDVPCGEGFTALHEAAYRGNEALVLWLLEKGAVNGMVSGKRNGAGPFDAAGWAATRGSSHLAQMISSWVPEATRHGENCNNTSNKYFKISVHSRNSTPAPI